MTNPVDIVIERFDGLSNAARAIRNGVTKQMIYGWRKRGVIPPKRQPQVLDAAIREGVSISAADIIVRQQRRGRRQ